MLERLVLRPELGAFENMLRERLDRVAALEDERIARPRTIERDADGSLVVVSEFVPGSRLSELLDISSDLGTAPGVDAALGFMLDILPALCGLHAGAGFAHGTIAPSRTVLTPAGQIVLLDAIYGGALAHVRYSRHKLWTEFNVAARPSAGSPRLDVDADIAQAALAAVMLVLGRPLRNDEYPGGLTNVVEEVVESAQIRASATFAAGLQEFLERALPLAHPRPYMTADDALFDVRELASELGIQVCRRALVEFIEQMEAGGQSPSAAAVYDDASDADAYLGDDTEIAASAGESEQDLDSAVDAEIVLDSLVEHSPYDLNDVSEIDVQPEPPAENVATVADWSTASSAVEAFDQPATPSYEPAVSIVGTTAAPAPVAAPPVSTGSDFTATSVTITNTPPVEQQPVVQDNQAADTTSSWTAETTDAEQPEDQAEVPSVRSRRAKRAIRSVRARKDKLRSVSATDKPAIVQPAPAARPTPPPIPPPTPPPIPAPAAVMAPPPEKIAASSSWLVPPDRAAAFEPPVYEAPAPPIPVPLAPRVTAIPQAAVPQPALVPAFPPPPALPAPATEPAFSRTVTPVPPIAPSYQPIPAWTPPAPTPSIGVASAGTPQIASLKLKEEPRRARAARPADAAADIYSAPSTPVAVAAETPTQFPWKLAAAAVVVMIGAIVGGRMYLPVRSEAAQDTTPSVTAAAAPAPAAAAAPTAGVTGSTGRLEIETQPAGARVLIDGKAAGESPLALDGVSAGRHVVTFVSSSGSVRRTVRVEAGRVVKLDVPIFSGWVGIYAPFVLQVSEAGQVIGTTEEPRLMLSPGSHTLTLTNRELGYSSQHSVDVEPGEERPIRIDPQGKVNLNATPWAEVWIDGRKVGDTPIANLQMPLGIREVTFRHPQLGERRVTLTVRGNTAAAVSVDMNKPEND